MDFLDRAAYEVEFERLVELAGPHAIVRYTFRVYNLEQLTKGPWYIQDVMHGLM